MLGANGIDPGPVCNYKLLFGLGCVIMVLQVGLGAIKSQSRLEACSAEEPFETQVAECYSVHNS